MKAFLILAGVAALVMIGSQSVTASAAQACELSRHSAHRHMSRSEMRRQQDFFAVRPYAPSPYTAGSLGFIGSSEAGN